MNPVNRREFLRTASLTFGAGVAFGSAPSAWSQAIGANDAVRIAVIGLNDKGANHVDHLRIIPDVRVVALCDIDPIILYREVERLRADRVKVFATTEAREVFDRKDVDAVVIATSNHWHALLTVWACQAGKDVYVEKPVSRTVWEGRKMVEAAERYGRMVQSGTQYRSDEGLPAAIAWIREGHLGRMLAIHTTCYKRRESIGRQLPWYPDWLNYDGFCGPTPVVPLERDRLEYDWHWVWRTGNGELGNNGIHVLDIARRFAGHDSLPQRVMSVGGHYVTDDVAETPNTQLAVYDYGDGVPLFFESRALPANPDTEDMDHNRGVRVNGVAVLCEGGYFSGYTGGGAYDNDGNQITRFPGDGGSSHMNNFLDAVRSRRADDLAAPIAIGHASTSLCHFGNVSHRVGHPAPVADVKASLESVSQAVATFEGMQQHLARHGVDLARAPLTLGPWLTLDAANETIASVEDADDASLSMARFLVKESQRPPYVIPDQA